MACCPRVQLQRECVVHVTNLLGEKLVEKKTEAFLTAWVALEEGTTSSEVQIYQNLCWPALLVFNVEWMELDYNSADILHLGLVHSNHIFD